MSRLIDPELSGQFDRLPPHSIEGEQCVLGSMMLSARAITQCILILERDSFYQTDHQIIFDIVTRLHAQNTPIDVTILREELIKRGLYEEVGGAAYLGLLLNTVPTPAHATHYAGIVREKFLLRQLIAASNDVLRIAYGPHEKADKAVDWAVEKFENIAKSSRVHAANMSPPRKVLLSERREDELQLIAAMGICSPDSPDADAVAALYDMGVGLSAFEEPDLQLIFGEIQDGTTALLEFLPALLEQHGFWDEDGTDSAVGPRIWNRSSLRRLLSSVPYDQAAMATIAERLVQRESTDATPTH